MDLDMELRMQLLEDRYASENRLIQDVFHLYNLL